MKCTVFFIVLLLSAIIFIQNELYSAASFTTDVIVAADGSGSFRTIAEAVAFAPTASSSRFTIYIKAGIYHENIVVNRDNISFIGEGMEQTIITSNRSARGNWTTTETATTAVLSRSDKSVFYKCSFKGYQDTLYAKENAQFFRECEVHGTVDFVFGDASAVFQNCNFLVRKPLPSQKNVITAHGRTSLTLNSGFVMQNCSIMATPDFALVKHLYKTYLGRPWKLYSRVIYMQSFLDDLIDSSGWLEWNGTFALDTLFYGEFQNRGPGAGTKGRVHWPGFKVMHSYAEALNFTVRNFIHGEEWIPSSGVPFTADFI